MENRFLKDSQISIAAVLISVATVASAFIFSQAFLQFKKFSTELINVTGSAEKRIVSDSIVWRVSFTKRAAVLADAYLYLSDNLKQVREYLLEKGIQDREMSAGPVQTDTLYVKNDKGADTHTVEGYRLTQQITVNSKEVEKVAGIANQVTELIPQGVELVSYSPEYFYTRLGELKIEMLREASRDAKKRAEEIAKASGNTISLIRSARMGVFQITPANSYDFSDWGSNDTSSYEKKVTAVVKADFAIK